MFQFTHPVRGATQAQRKAYGGATFQFTHPVRGATKLRPNKLPRSLVSIHAPHAGCDSRHNESVGKPLSFNSRTPCGVRPCPMSLPTLLICVSIHAPHAGCDLQMVQTIVNGMLVSIHAPHAGCDQNGDLSDDFPEMVSIHAPHAGCDAAACVGSPAQGRFNSRTPCGVRHLELSVVVPPLTFQFTHPMRGATRRDSSPYS